MLIILNWWFMALILVALIARDIFGFSILLCGFVFAGSDLLLRAVYLNLRPEEEIPFLSHKCGGHLFFIPCWMLAALGYLFNFDECRTASEAELDSPQDNNAIQHHPSPSQFME